MQVDPLKPTLKAPGTKHLKLKYDKRLLSFAFKFNLRRYSQAQERELMKQYEVGRRRLTLSHPS